MVDLAAFADAEHEFLRARQRREFFLALSRYTTTLESKRRIRRIIAKLEAELKATLTQFVSEQNTMIEDARAVREELAMRAPEVDNSDMDEPDHVAHDRWRYDLDSFARFDSLVAADHPIGYRLIPKDDDDPGPISPMLQILRGRYRAAKYGEDAAANADPIRDDLADLGTRIGNLGERHRMSVQRYRLHSRTLAGTAWVRLVYFGSDLVAEAVEIESEQDIEEFLDRSIREWRQPKTSVRKLANGNSLDEEERRSTQEVEVFLKAEAERFHRELVARLTTGRRSVLTLVREEPLAVTIVGGVIAAVVAGVILTLLLTLVKRVLALAPRNCRFHCPRTRHGSP